MCWKSFEGSLDTSQDKFTKRREFWLENKKFAAIIE